MGKEGQQVPVMDDAFVQSVTDRYIELYERITGARFHARRAPSDINARIQRALERLSGDRAKAEAPRDPGRFRNVR